MTELNELLETAESTLQTLTDDSSSAESIDVESAIDAGKDAIDSGKDAMDTDTDTVDGGDENGVLDDLDAVIRAIDEAESMLESIDFTELPDAIDGETVVDAIDAGEIPAAVQESEDADVVKLRHVMRAIQMRELLAAVDVSALWEAKRGFDDAIEDVAGDSDDGGVVQKAADAATGDDGVVGDDDDELIETDLDDATDMAASAAMDDFELSDGDMSEYEAIIQQQAIEGVDAFRDGLLKAHGKFERLYELNREKMRMQDTQPNSRNPTAVSTITTERTGVGSVPNYSTMPRQVRHSNAPARKHIYGKRFEWERTRRGYDDE